MSKFNYDTNAYNDNLGSSYDEGLKKYFLKIYFLMSFGLFVTAIAALLIFSVPSLTIIIFNIGSDGQLIGMTGLGWMISFAPLGISLYFAFEYNRITTQNAQILFWLYSALIGISLASLGFVYSGSSIVKTFFICSSMFAAMSLYGYTTKKDLTSMGSFLFMGLIGLLIASLSNMFFRSPALEFTLSIIGIFVFTGLIAFDTQKLKDLYYRSVIKNKKLGIIAALTLYLDFINLFLYLLRFLGRKRED